MPANDKIPKTSFLCMGGGHRLWSREDARDQTGGQLAAHLEKCALPCKARRAPGGPDDPANAAAHADGDQPGPAPAHRPPPAVLAMEDELPALFALPALPELSAVLESPVAAGIAAVLLAAAAVLAMVLFVTISADFRAQVADHRAQAAYQLQECRRSFDEKRCKEPVLWTAKRCRATQASFRQPVLPPSLTHMVLSLLKTAGSDLVSSVEIMGSLS